MSSILTKRIHLHWYEAFWGSPMLKVDNIILLWRVVIPKMVSESCPKLSHDNRILKYQTKIVSLESVVKK